MVFHLPLRQTEGCLDSLLWLMELGLKAPDQVQALARKTAFGARLESQEAGGTDPVQCIEPDG